MKNFNPALHTFKEYYDMISDGKFHDDGAYSINLERFNEYNKADNFEYMINRFKLHGREFLLKESREDRWEFSLYKRDKDGEIQRKENGDIVYLSMEEKQQKIPEDKRWIIQHAIIDSKTGMKVAATQDEWGCVLVSVANEYKGLGLGQKLLDHHRKINPLGWSGGHTPQGYNAFTRSYQKMVKDAMVSGLYSKMIKKGEMTVQRAREIIKSAHITKKDVEQYNIENGRIGKSRGWGEKLTYKEEMKDKFDKGLDLDFSNPDDLMIHISESDNTAILYSKKFYKILQEKSGDELVDRFMDEGIAGYVYLGANYGTDTAPLFYHVHGEKSKHKSLLIEILLNSNLNENVRIAEEDYHLLSSKILDNCELINEDNGMTELKMVKRTIDKSVINSIKSLDTLYRRKHDPYEEAFTIIHERAYGNAVHEYEQKQKKEAKMSNDIKVMLSKKIDSTEVKQRLKKNKLC